jgi:hypothetical protein
LKLTEKSFVEANGRAVAEQIDSSFEAFYNFMLKYLLKPEL